MSNGNNQSEAERRLKEQQMARRTNMENQGDDTPIAGRGDQAPLAKDPSIARNDLADAATPPSGKHVASAIPGAEMEAREGSAARGATGGTKGASSSSAGRAGDPDNYGVDQAGPGLATGPAITNRKQGQ